MTAGSEEQDASSAVTDPSPVAPAGKADRIRVLLIDDDEDYRVALAGDLSDRGFCVQCFADGASFLQSPDAAIDAHVVVLDWSLPQTSGIDLLPQMRRRGIRLPVVFLTGLNSSACESLAFDRGATDFIDKARGVDILARRLRRATEAAARPNAGAVPEKVMVLGKLVLNQAVSRASWNGIDVGLTVGEYKIVNFLASNAGRYVTYRAIYDCVHYAGFVAGTGDHGYRTNVRSCIKRIRSKFHECDPAFDEIRNYQGFGYCWRKPA